MHLYLIINFEYIFHQLIYNNLKLYMMCKKRINLYILYLFYSLHNMEIKINNYSMSNLLKLLNDNFLLLHLLMIHKHLYQYHIRKIQYLIQNNLYLYHQYKLLKQINMMFHQYLEHKLNHNLNNLNMLILFQLQKYMLYLNKLFQ